MSSLASFSEFPYLFDKAILLWKSEKNRRTVWNNKLESGGIIMFIEKLKDEILREKFEEHRGMLRAMMAGGDMSNSPFADIIKENK